MNERIKKLENLPNHPWYSKQYGRLPKRDKALIREFIENFGNLPPADYWIEAVNLFLDKENKPRKWTTITEILSTLR